MIVYGRSIAPRGSFRSKPKVNGLLHDLTNDVADRATQRHDKNFVG